MQQKISQMVYVIGKINGTWILSAEVIAWAKIFHHLYTMNGMKLIEEHLEIGLGVKIGTLLSMSRHWAGISWAGQLEVCLAARCFPAPFNSDFVWLVIFWKCKLKIVQPDYTVSGILKNNEPNCVAPHSMWFRAWEINREALIIMNLWLHLISNWVLRYKSD